MKTEIFHTYRCPVCRRKYICDDEHIKYLNENPDLLPMCCETDEGILCFIEKKKMNPYKEYVRLLKQLHKLQIGKRNENNDDDIAEQCDNIRDEMETFYDKMSEEEIALSNQMSADLWAKNNKGK